MIPLGRAPLTIRTRHLIVLILSVYPTVISSPPALAQFAQQGPALVGTGAVGRAYQGSSVSLSADANTAIVGGFSDDNSTGAAWAWTRSGGIWTQQGTKLVALGPDRDIYQGKCVSLSADGNTAIVGEGMDPGLAPVYCQCGRTLSN
jgi:hypothetical protein